MTQAKVGARDLIDLRLTLDWESEQGRHREIQHFQHYHVWRDLDLLPPKLQSQILHQRLGHCGEVILPAGELTPMHDQGLVYKVKRDQFQRHFHGRELTPHLGRFYPQGMVEGLPGVFSDSILPLRITALDDKTLSCDLNHPLAGRELKLSSRVEAIHGPTDEHGGRCQDALQPMLRGPGMQIRNQGQATDFFSGEPFKRIDETPDSVFYGMSRMLDHLDRRALDELSRLYGELLPTGGRVLDLMASFDSHLPTELTPAALVGLGMNEEELAANARLSERLLQDLNQKPLLPFADDSFDAVVCTVSVEYLTQPLAVFGEVARVLKPGGVFINSFSNRWFPPKVIALWIDLHEYERMGLVSEYYLHTNGFGPVNTWSQQGLARPEDDKYGSQFALSDPLYVVWSHKV